MAEVTQRRNTVPGYGPIAKFLSFQYLLLRGILDVLRHLDAIDAAHRLAVKLGQKDVALLLLKASLDVSDKIETSQHFTKPDCNEEFCRSFLEPGQLSRVLENDSPIIIF